MFATPPLQFSEVGVRVGLGREHPGAFSAPPHAPGGVAGDFDGDGAQDLFYATGGGARDRLFINRRDGTFIDRAVPAGLARVHRAHGAAAADFDGDGTLDLFIPSAGPEEPGLPPPGHLLLYRGNGDGTFTCCAPYRDPDGRLDRGAGGMAAAFGDYDLDGDLDLFVGNWGVRHPRQRAVPQRRRRRLHGGGRARRRGRRPGAGLRRAVRGPQRRPLPGADRGRRLRHEPLLPQRG